MLYASYREESNPHKYIFTTIPCPTGLGGCGKQEEIEVVPEELFRYNQGNSIQVALKSLTPGQRERFFAEEEDA